MNSVLHAILWFLSENQQSWTCLWLLQEVSIGLLCSTDCCGYVLFKCSVCRYFYYRSVTFLILFIIFLCLVFFFSHSSLLMYKLYWKLMCFQLVPPSTLVVVFIASLVCTASAMQLKLRSLRELSDDTLHEKLVSRLLWESAARGVIIHRL